MSDTPLDPTQTRERLSYLTARLCHSHRNAVNEVLNDLGLHVGQEMLLLCLADNSGATHTELAECLSVQQATVTRMVNRLERSGLVSRCKDPADQRISRVSLTSEGQALLEPIAEVWRSVEGQMLAGFTMEERIVLRRLLMQVYQNLND
jgi:DNA-binding MarR family transcriptional regulator